MFTYLCRCFHIVFTKKLYYIGTVKLTNILHRFSSQNKSKTTDSNVGHSAFCKKNKGHRSVCIIIP